MSSRLLLIVVGSALLVAGVVASLATESWVWFGVALGAHALFAGLVIATALTLTTEVEKPGPTTVTALEAEGVADPEGALNDLVEQVADQDESSRVERTLTRENDTTQPDEDRAAAAAGQQSAVPRRANRRGRRQGVDTPCRKQPPLTLIARSGARCWASRRGRAYG